MSTLISFASIDGINVESYTRDDLMVCRAYVLFVKRTARQGGFGQCAGRMMRETIGYKFDGMSVDSVLSAMEAPDFVARYTVKLDGWYNALNKSANDSTLKRNAALYKSASALASDETSFKRLVRALRVLCVRNQAWNENGQNIALQMNGHRALLDLFGVNVTNTRRLALSAQ
jgi:hypothetical protein